MNLFKKADLLGISVDELINNYTLIFDVDGFFYGAAFNEDIDKYFISHDNYLDTVVLVDLTSFIDTLKVLRYNFLEEVLEG